jgi:hypothetical protein
MKKIAVLTLGLMLAATPAFAEAVIDQYADQNSIGNSLGNSYANSANEGAGNLWMNNDGGIITQNANAGMSSNVGTANDVQITGGVSMSNGTINAGNASDGNQLLSLASLVQVASNNSLGNAVGVISNSTSSNLGVSNSGVISSQGIVTQSINVGAASNVGTATAITIH